MENGTSSSSAIAPPHAASNYDEIFMQHSLIFAESLKDLKTIRKQLYSAAEYFESSYHYKDDQKQLVIETLKDYVAKALISTVDHLGSVAYKVNNFLDEKVHEVSTTELRFSCIEQKLGTCQELIDSQGSAQQSLLINTPRYHKRYIIPVQGSISATGKSAPIQFDRTICPKDGLHQSSQEARVRAHMPLFSKEHSELPARIRSLSSHPLKFSFTMLEPKKNPENRTISPLRFSLKRSGSLANRAISPSFSNSRQRYPSEPRKSGSFCIQPERDSTKEIELYSRKSKSLLKALLSIHKGEKGKHTIQIPG